MYIVFELEKCGSDGIQRQLGIKYTMETAYVYNI